MSTHDGEVDLQRDALRHAPGYVDPRYLQTLATALERQRQRGYELLRLQPGHRVLDLGCGPATDTINLAGLVGPTGTVVGVDHDPAMVAEAKRRAEAAGVDGWTEHVEADALALPFDAGSFDRVRVQRVFQHLPQPEAAFAELVRVTKPGGWILVFEPDWGTLSIDSTHTDLERRYVRFFAEGYIRNGYAGRQLYRWCVSHRLEEIVVETYPSHHASYAHFRDSFLAERLEPAAVAAGALTQDEIDRLRQEWQRADEEGTFFASGHGIAVVARKP